MSDRSPDLQAKIDAWPAMRKLDQKLKRMKQEENEGKALRDQWPGRWPDWASPRRMRADLQREREEDEQHR